MTFLVTNTSPQTKTQKHCFWWNHIAGPMLPNIDPDGRSSVSPACQPATAAGVDLVHQLDGVSRIVVVSC